MKTRAITKKGRKTSEVPTNGNPRVEILTATQEGLAAFLLNVKRARARHAFSREKYEQKVKALPPARREKAWSYDVAIDRLVASGDKDQRQQAVTARMEHETAMAQMLADMGKTERASLVVTITGTSLPPLSAVSPARCRTHGRSTWSARSHSR